MAIIDPSEWHTLHIAKFNDWVLSVGANQHVLGWLIIFPPRKFEGSIVHLTDEELSDFRKIGLISEKLLNRVFGAEWFNYCQQGNTIARIHIHLQPRYSKEIEMFGHKFTDTGWGGLIKFQKDDELAPKEVVMQIVKTLRDEVAKMDIQEFKVEIMTS